MEKLRARMEGAGVWNAEAALKLEEFWKFCVEAIADSALKLCLAGFLEEEAPAQFFCEGASATGRHHPSWQNQRFGMLRNTVECCLLVPAMAQYVEGMVDADRKPIPGKVDIALAATVVSDTFKVGANGERTGPEHGSIAAAHWKAYASRRQLVGEDVIDDVFSAVYWHYGIYTPAWRKGVVFTPETRLVHLVDAFMAQKSLERLFHPKGVVV
jgi:hypothetical protein